MSERHGTALRLTRHEDLEKVATYVKQQVREKSLEQCGEDLSVDDKFVGLQINEEENNIIWHDYGHHGKHLDFYPIAESVIKEFPDVKMELKEWYGQEVWNYIIVDGEWKEYTLWKFVSYAKSKGEELLLEYKEMKDNLSEEEQRDERYRMCKELAEQQSLQLPGMDIAVYCYDYYDIYFQVREFYRAKNGCASHRNVEDGLRKILSLDMCNIDWIECTGQVLLEPMECAAEIIRRARKGEDLDTYAAIRMMLYGDTARYFSLIEPSDKDWLMKQAEENSDIGAIYCLLFGMNNKFRYWNETYVDEDTNEEVTILRYAPIDGSTFEKQEGEEARLVQIIIDDPYRYSYEEIKRVCQVSPNNAELLRKCKEKGN